MLAVFPNPTSGMLTIRDKSATNTTLNYFLYNLLGECVLQGNTSSQTEQLNCSKLSGGSYILSLEKSIGNVRRKIQISK